MWRQVRPGETVQGHQRLSLADPWRSVPKRDVKKGVNYIIPNRKDHAMPFDDLLPTPAPMPHQRSLQTAETLQCRLNAQLVILGLKTNQPRYGITIFVRSENRKMVGLAAT